MRQKEKRPEPAANGTAKNPCGNGDDYSTARRQLDFIAHLLAHESLILSRACKSDKFRRWQEAIHSAVVWADFHSPEIVDVLCRISCDLREADA
jgi:hypothetical protein